MGQLRVDKIQTDNKFSVTFEMINLTANDEILVRDHGEPQYTFGGVYDPNSGSFLQRYFPTAKELIQDWEQFKAYSTGDEVIKDSTYFRALQPVSFDSFPDWVQWQSEALLWDAGTEYLAGTKVFYQPDGNFYTANVDTSTVSPNPSPVDSPTVWTVSTAPVVQFTDGSYYKALREIDFAQFSNWVAGTQYLLNNVIKFTDNNYYKAIQSAPVTWSSSKTDYAVGELVYYSGVFYESLVNAPTVGTTKKFDLTSVAGTFVAGQTVTQANSGATGVVTAYDATGEILTVNVTSGTFTTYAGAGDEIENTLSPVSGSGQPTVITNFDPASNTTEWTTTLKADPITDSGEYWEVFEDFDPAQPSSLYWGIYTDQDPGTSYWTAFNPDLEGRTSPSSTQSFTVNQITRSLPSGLPITFTFDGDALAQAEANADDFAEVVKVDIKEIWDDLETKSNTFNETEILDL